MAESISMEETNTLVDKLVECCLGERFVNVAISLADATAIAFMLHALDNERNEKDAMATAKKLLKVHGKHLPVYLKKRFAVGYAPQKRAARERGPEGMPQCGSGYSTNA